MKKLLIVFMTVALLLICGCEKAGKIYGLKPCPICGSTNVVAFVWGSKFEIYCNSCKFSSSESMSQEMATKLWNEASDRAWKKK